MKQSSRTDFYLKNTSSKFKYDIPTQIFAIDIWPRKKNIVLQENTFSWQNMKLIAVGYFWSPPAAL